MRHHHWLYGSPSYWPRPINGLYQCKTKQISPATPDLISIIHLIVSWCDLITPLSSYLFPINIHRIGAFSIEPSSQHWAGSSLAGSFRLISNEIELLWIFFASTPGFPQSAIKLSMSAPEPGETMPRPELSTNQRPDFGSRDRCRPIGGRGDGGPITGRMQHTDWIVRILECTAGIFDISIMLLMIHQEIITNS